MKKNSALSIKTLGRIVSEIPIKPVECDPSGDAVVTGISFDSRTVQPGHVFFALVGGATDGHDFIDSAIDNGASAVVGINRVKKLSVPYIRVTNTREYLAYFSAAFHDFPGRALTVIGVTGTDGKTTTATLIHMILLKAGFKAGLISTINAIIGDKAIDTGFHVTTPEAPDVQKYLRQMVDAGLTHVVLEATSHGLAQHRVTGCEFDIGVVTNITHEHLDYHGDFQTYMKAKGTLFQMLSTTAQKNHGNPRLAVINKDDLSYNYLSEITKVNQLSYGLTSLADIYSSSIETTFNGTNFYINSPGGSQKIRSSLFGDYNVSNCLAAYTTTVFGLKITPVIAAEGIESLKSVSGRMERIDLGQDFTAIVDFAHTPNALKRVLETTRNMTDQRVIAVFGSAGLRDREKRRLMAEISVKLADITILTAEDPRTESLAEILEEMIMAGLGAGGKEMESIFRIEDRGEAIRFAVSQAKPGDVVIVCGKGHEQSMCFGNIEYPWDDRTAMKAALAERFGITGFHMPILPTSNK